MHIKEKLGIVVVIAFILVILSTQYPQLEKISQMFLDWLPSLFIGIFLTAIAGVIVANVGISTKIVIFGSIPLAFVLTLVIRMLLQLWLF